MLDEEERSSLTMDGEVGEPAEPQARPAAEAPPMTPVPDATAVAPAPVPPSDVVPPTQEAAEVPSQGIKGD